MSVEKGIFFHRVKDTKVFPVSLKIIVIFILFILVSNFATNYINIMLGREYQLRLTKQLLAKDLKDIYGFANTQFEIFQYNKDKKGSFENIKNRAFFDLKNKKSVLLCISREGDVLGSASNTERKNFAIEKNTLSKMNNRLMEGQTEDYISTKIAGDDYFGVYKFNEKWNMYIIRAEEYKEFSSESHKIFLIISAIIIAISFCCTLVGVYVLRRILRFIGIITTSIMQMIKKQQLGLINLKGAPNDDITYMGMAFNSLSSSIDILINIFRKFANKDVVIKAYRDKEILLEGSRKELAILFTDIKGFTYITETLGTDIIKLINLHYDQAIREIVKYDGVIGSIIGDALLAVFGTIDDVAEYNKSYASVMSAYQLQDIALKLRETMAKKYQALSRKKQLSAEEDRIYKAVLIEIGVGIDGGEVFYGNIGSYVRMTNTVIGDNVNSASRLEGLTRIYNVPVICSDYIKDDIEKNVKDHGFTFIEIDIVQVKGKTEGKRIYWPVRAEDYTGKTKKNVLLFSSALLEYYDGNWKKANLLFRKCDLPVAKVFIERTREKCPRDWKGIWAMTSK